jgi:hypothetical protein
MGGRIRLQLMVDDFMMRLRQLIPVLFCGPRAEKPNRYTTEKAIAIPLARCARVPRATVRLPALSSWQGGSFAPRCIPRTRSVAPWTSPKALRPLDFRPGGVSPSGHLTMGAFLPRLDPQTKGDFALPLDTHRPAVRRLDLRQGFRAPGPRRGGGPCPRPPANPGRIGCAHKGRYGATLRGEILP